MPPTDELTIETVLGRDVVVSVNGEPQENWEKVSLKPEIGTFNKNSADSAFEQYDLGRRKCSGSLSYLLGGKNVPRVLPGLGDEITSLDFVVETNKHLLPADLSDVTKWGKCRVVSTPYELQDTPGTITVDIMWGFRR